MYGHSPTIKGEGQGLELPQLTLRISAGSIGPAFGDINEFLAARLTVGPVFYLDFRQNSR